MTTTVSDTVKKIKAVLGFGKVPDANLLKQLDAMIAGMTGNTAFSTPPVDMATFKTAVDTYDTMVTDALDGGKKAISAKQKQRAVVIKLATQLGHYVEAASNNDLATFNTSGFVAVSKPGGSWIRPAACLVNSARSPRTRAVCCWPRCWSSSRPIPEVPW